MYLNAKAETTTLGILLSLALALAAFNAGCEGTQAQKMRSTPVSEITTAETSGADNLQTLSQRQYDEMIAARTGRPSRHHFTQVSLFGDLPGIAAGQSQFQPEKSLQQHTFATEGEAFDPQVSPDGKWLVFASTQHTLKPDIYIKPIHGTAITQITSHPAGDVQPTFSPDSRRIAFSSDRAGQWNIFLVNIDGRNLQQLTNDPTPEMHPSFSPDGTKLTYCRYNLQSGQWEIWLMDVNNPGHRKFIAPGLFPSFSPVENKIVYQRPYLRGSQLFSIWYISLGHDDQPSAPTEIVSAKDRALIGPKWSEDGKRIVYCSVLPNQKSAVTDAQIWITDLTGQGRMPVTDPGIAGFSPAWGADGRIYFCANRGETENIWSVAPIVEKQTTGVIAAQPEPQPIRTRPETQTQESALTGKIQPNYPIQLYGDSNVTVEVRD